MHPAITGISSMATRALLAELAEAYTARRGAPVAIESVGGVDAARRVRAGEVVDLVVLAADAIERLAADGHVHADSCAALVRSEVAVAVREGAPRPRLADEADLREAMLNARRIGHSTGPSGVALQAMVARWGLADTLADRLVQAPPGVPVGTLLAQGEVEIGFQQLSELMHLPGIDLIGPMPPGTEIVTTFSAAVGARAAQPQAARQLIEFLAGAEAHEAKRRHGMAPA